MEFGKAACRPIAFPAAAKIRRMPLWKIIVLSVVQGFAELLPVSSSAHVVVTEKLMGLDPSSPQMTLVLVMLHTGTMFAVITYFWKRWRAVYFQNLESFKNLAWRLALATLLTGAIGEIIIKLIERMMSSKLAHAQIEDLFSHLEMIAPALAAAGILILIAGMRERRTMDRDVQLTLRQAGLIGAVQGLCVPFRGFSRSGATISAGMLAGVPRNRAEMFSFALAVILTPPVVAREVLRLVHSESNGLAKNLFSAVAPSILGAVFSFVAGLIALRWLSSWLESGRWYFFGIYCIAAAAVVAALYSLGY